MPSLLICFSLAASFYGVPPRVLASIQAVELGRLGTVSKNANGTEDLGPMQVNTIWIPALAKHTGLSETAVRDRLIGSNCFSATAAAAILKTYLMEARGNLMTAIGYYHSHTPIRGERYRLRVVRVAGKIFHD